jgi:hypothetical protein
MKCLTKIAVAFLLLLPMLAYADWQVARPDSAIPTEPFFQAGTQPNTAFVPSYSNSAFPNRFGNLGRPAAVYAISVCGSLKENLERIMDRYHWRVVWKAPYDYNFDGRVTGSSLPDVIERLLKPFPLQAKLYMSNRTMLVVQRN